MLEIMLQSTSPRDKKSIRNVNQYLKNLDHEYNSKMFVMAKEPEDFSGVWDRIKGKK
jgi:energy-coupling factor transporter ATP-binding protein EcfA2